MQAWELIVPQSCKIITQRWKHSNVNRFESFKSSNANCFRYIPLTVDNNSKFMWNSAKWQSRPAAKQITPFVSHHKTTDRGQAAEHKHRVRETTPLSGVRFSRGFVDRVTRSITLMYIHVSRQRLCLERWRDDFDVFIRDGGAVCAPFDCRKPPDYSEMPTTRMRLMLVRNGICFCLNVVFCILLNVIIVKYFRYVYTQ